jgi:hypothetical protein
MPQYQHISQKQLDGAKIFSNRWDWVSSLNKGLDIIEVGVGSGDYSNHILNCIRPNSLLLIDQFDIGDYVAAKPNLSPRFTPETHYDFVFNRFKDHKNVEMIRGNSINVLSQLLEQGRSFDMIYVDASHHYDSVSKDILYASKLLKGSGILAINDYVSHSEDNGEYGVILATNEFLLNNPGWHVVGFALEEQMFADIYLSRTGPAV